MRRLAVLVTLIGICGCSSKGAHPPESETAAPLSNGGASKEVVSYLEAGEDSLRDLDTAVQDQLRRAETLTNQGQYRLAIEALSQLIARHPETALAFVLRGRVNGELHHDADALADFSTAVRMEPQNASHYAARGFFLLSRGTAGEAIKDFNASIARNPNDARAYNHRGMARVTKGEWKQAIADFNKAIEIDPRFANAYANRSLALSKVDRRKEALADLDQAIKLDPKSASSYNNRGVLYLDRQDYDKALADFSKAIQLDKNNLSFHENRRQTNLRCGRYAAAEADAARIEKLMQLSALNDAVFRDKRSPRPYIERGSYFLAEGDLNNAAGNFDRAIQLGPKQWEAYQERARLNIRRGEYQKAIDDCETAIKLEPHDETLGIRGDAYRKLGEYDKAVADYEASQRFDREVADTWVLHSQALRKAHHVKEADAALQRANEFKKLNAPNGN
jgi:tetratricopeptide (TPR) repeat protein